MNPMLVFIASAFAAALFRSWLVNFGKALLYNVVFHVFFGVVGALLLFVYEPAVVVSPFIAALFGYTVPAFFESLFSVFGEVKWH